MGSVVKKGRCTQCNYPSISNKHYKLCPICNQKRLKALKEASQANGSLNTIRAQTRSVPRGAEFGRAIKKAGRYSNKNAPNNRKFYLKFWALTEEHYCTECGEELLQYDAGYVSHYLPKGPYPALAFDVENAQLHCGRHHTQWDAGDRFSMTSWSEERYHYLMRKYKTVSKSVK